MRKVLKKELKKIVEKIAIKSATTEANATCPWVSYQPEIPEAAKKLRKHWHGNPNFFKERKRGNHPQRWGINIFRNKISRFYAGAPPMR